MAATVIEALRAFLPRFLESAPPLCEAQTRALWAIAHCRTPAMGGHLYACGDCGKQAFAYHSCNHRACPQCGRAATAAWVERELGKRVGAPYFMVTFTLPAELRALFFGAEAKEAYDLFFRAASSALAEALASPKWLGAQVSGFSAVLHTWNQRLHFHPHIHMIVPGAGIDARGRVVMLKNENFLLPVPVLRRAFRRHFREGLKGLGARVEPIVWSKDWGVHIAPFGNGVAAIKYLGAYVCRSAIADSRLVSIGAHTVTFRWKDRQNGGHQRTETLCGLEFVRRYMRHVLPRGMRSIRYFGFCHPAAKRNRERVAFFTGRILRIGLSPEQPAPAQALGVPACPCCKRPMKRVQSFRAHFSRGPPLAA